MREPEKTQMWSPLRALSSKQSRIWTPVPRRLSALISRGLNRSGFDAASFFEKDADYVEALPDRAA
jgi:hypothetical protein